ncbi:MAG: DNA translocase FtsK, partial [Candidatus Acidoferrales bacterium]
SVDADDELYEEAVRIVCELGKASTSTLQRRLRIGYGRAARLLDIMEQEGVIGPPDGSRPREVLKKKDFLRV